MKMKEEKKEQVVTIVKYENGDMGVEIKASLSGKELLDAFSAFTIAVLATVPATTDSVDKENMVSVLAETLKGYIGVAAGMVASDKI